MTTQPLDDAQIDAAVNALEGWVRHGDTITRSYAADDFPAAIHIVNVVAVLAEQARHHPDIDIRWRTLTFTLSTHDAGGRITGRDLELAAQINAAIATQPPAR